MAQLATAHTTYAAICSGKCCQGTDSSKNSSTAQRQRRQAAQVTEFTVVLQLPIAASTAREGASVRQECRHQPRMSPCCSGSSEMCWKVSKLMRFPRCADRVCCIFCQWYRYVLPLKDMAATVCKRRCMFRTQQASLSFYKNHICIVSPRCCLLSLSTSPQDQYRLAPCAVPVEVTACAFV